MNCPLPCAIRRKPGSATCPLPGIDATVMGSTGRDGAHAPCAQGRGHLCSCAAAGYGTPGHRRPGIPEYIRFVEAMPKTCSGTIIRRMLRTVAGNVHDAPDDTTALARSDSMGHKNLLPGQHETASAAADEQPEARAAVSRVRVSHRDRRPAARRHTMRQAPVVHL